jgi:hypothetical protein
MVKILNRVIFIVLYLSLSQLWAQNKYSIYTDFNELENCQINTLDGDDLIISSGELDMKISISKINIISKSPPPSTKGQYLGKNIGGCGGMIVGFISGVIVFPKSLGVREEGLNGLRAFIIAGLVAGGYYGKKYGGNYFRGEPELLANMAKWSSDEKKTFIQTNLIQ